MSLTIRQRLTLAVILISALMLVVLVLGFNIALRSSLEADADSLLDARAQAALQSVGADEGKVEVGEASDVGSPDSLVWVFADGRTLEIS